MRRLFRKPLKNRLVAISVARDEEDVIEAFVRHTATLVDHHLIVDHCSHDRTAEILQKLGGEGLAISVLRCADPIYNQPPVTNVLMRRAIEEFGADWVLPLDADEFITPPQGDGIDGGDLLRDAIAAAPARARCLIYPFRTYHPSEFDRKDEPNAVYRIRHCFVKETGEHHKIMVHRTLAGREGARIMPGNHHFKIGDRQVEPEPLSGFALAHYAVRSLGQYVRKIATAELGKDSFGKKRKGLGIQKTAPFELLKTAPDRFFETALTPDRALVQQPGCYLGDPLRYTELEDEVAATLRSVLSMSHDIARQLGALRDRHRDKGVDPIADTSGVKLELVDTPPQQPEPPARHSPTLSAPEVEELLHF